MSLGKAFIRLPDASPGIRNDVACHIENADFVKFLETLAMTVGQNVPYRRRFRPHDHERQLWRSISQANRAQAAAGLTMRQALDVVRSRQWRTHPHFSATQVSRRAPGMAVTWRGRRVSQLAIGTQFSCVSHPQKRRDVTSVTGRRKTVPAAPPPDGIALENP